METLEAKTCGLCLKDRPVGDFRDRRHPVLDRCSQCRQKTVKFVSAELKPSITIKPRDKKYIERFDHEKAHKESINRLNQRPFYVK